MRLFHCAHCENLVYFENHQCVSCGHTLAYLPDRGEVTSLDEQGDTWAAPAAPGRQYRLCENYRVHRVCNWAIEAGSTEGLCASCRLTRLIPDVSLPQWRFAWYQLEVAKRRLVYELVTLGLPVVAKADDPPSGLAFEFRADAPDAAARVVTGHVDGVITIALAEADDAEREKRRLQLHEPYRTLLGHFRHESGHYYWDRLIRDGGRQEEFRGIFGDERADYGGALAQYYATGAPADWPERFLSAYASAHPWEDWAETWAHYLHMVDALETAAVSGVQFAALTGSSWPTDQFAGMLREWHGLTHLLNNLNRSLGLRDAYPFVLSAAAVNKMRYVHEVIRAVGVAPGPAAAGEQA